MAPRKPLVAIILLTLLPATAGTARAWIFHEHREITSEAISRLDEPQAAALVRLWAAGRHGREARFCAEVNAAPPAATPECLDFATWPAIGGDHSCSFDELLTTVSDAAWILQVAAIGARTGRDLAAASNERQANSAYVRYTLDLARTDPAPGVRGAGNNGHFALNRETNDPREYLSATVRDGASLNAAGIYSRNHLAALRLAAAWAAGGLPAEEQAALARAALAHEAFGLHFLEDSFAAGHVAGCWGRGAERLGTHDYYNRHGLETMNWKGENTILLGDRYLRPKDRERASSAVRTSLAQLIEAARPGSEISVAVSSLPMETAREASPFEVCETTVFPEGEPPGSLHALLLEVIAQTPMPGRGPGIAALPRARAEVGAFVSWVSGARVGVLQGQFDRRFDGTFVDGEISLGLRGGAGFDGLTGRSGDGLMFLQIGVANRQEKGPYYSSDSPTETLPGRTGIELRLRVPFWLVPGDLMIAGPVLAFASPQKLKTMAITAANGGLVPWQRAMPFGEQGRLQFVFGREVGLTLHGQWGADHFMMPVKTAPGQPAEMREVEVRTTEWEFPILEYRAFHTFAARQAYTANMQLGAGFDRPTDAEVVDMPSLTPPDLRTRYFVYMKVTLEMRHYF